MTKPMKKFSGTASSFPAGLAYSGFAALALTVAGSAVIGKLIEKSWIPQEKIGYGVMILLFLVSIVAAAIAAGKIRHRRLLACFSSGVLYFGILLGITALFFGAQYSMVGETGGIILAGSLLAALMGSRPGAVGRKRRKG